MALMIQPYVKLNPDYAVLAAFLSGIIIFLLGVLNLGKCVLCESPSLEYPFVKLSINSIPV